MFPIANKGTIHIALIRYFLNHHCSGKPFVSYRLGKNVVMFLSVPEMSSSVSEKCNEAKEQRNNTKCTESENRVQGNSNLTVQCIK